MYENTRLRDIPKINSTTKVKIWVEIINRLLDDGSSREYIFKAYSIAGIDEYVFSDIEGLPENYIFPEGNYVVTYGGAILQPDDYQIKNKSLKFVNGPPLENDYLITIRYEGMGDEIKIKQSDN